MNNLLLPFTFFVGITYSYIFPLEIPPLATSSILLVFIFCIGRDIAGMFQGCSLKGKEIRSFTLYTCLNLMGSLVGGAFIGFILTDLSATDGVLVASSMGFYSIGGTLVSVAVGTKMGILCFIVNFLRESIVLLFGSIIGRMSTSANVYISGAAAMDTCLATIKETGGNHAMIFGVISGGILTVIAPLLVNIVLYFY